MNLFFTSKVYPAYWQNEPQALTLAKKQYALMRDGMSEDLAYEKAVEYVNSLENTSYEEMMNFQQMLYEKGTNKPFLTDDSIAEELVYWKGRLKEIRYKDLELGEQGEIDFFIQTKLLKWNEVDRERRMKDPIFVMQFSLLRQSLFNVNLGIDGNLADSSDEEKESEERVPDDVKEVVRSDWLGKLHTSKFFYVEDYVYFLKKAKAKPSLTKWNSQEREKLNQWISETLAFKAVMDRKTPHEAKQYIDELRAQYFPLLHLSHLAKSFVIPTVEDLKRLLYNNQVGYKTENSFTFVKRFYRLPMLLFPLETFAARLHLQSNDERLQAILGGEDDSGLISDLNNSGLGEASVPEIRRQLKELLKTSRESAELPNYSVLESSDNELFSSSKSGAGGLSVLDDLLKDSFPDDVGSDVKKSSSALPYQSNFDWDDDEEAEEVTTVISEEERELVEAFKNTHSSPYAEERNALFISSDTVESLDELKTLEDVENFKSNRLETEIMIRARLMHEYEEKESARRVREWKRRGVLLDRFPRPVLKIE